jgi:hypothetical protein
MSCLPKSLHWGVAARAAVVIGLVAITGASATLWAASGEPGVVFTGVGLTVRNETVPPGGMLQIKVEITEPKPILKGRQGLKFSSASLGAVQGVAAFSPKGDVSGVAVIRNGNAQVTFRSPLSTFGTSIDYPILTIAVPVLATATPGQKVNLTLDPSIALWLDPVSNTYPVELKSGVLTVGGTLSVSNVLPGSGPVPAGATIRIRGVGFLPTSIVTVNGSIVTTKRYLSANEIQITLGTTTNMTGRRIRVINHKPVSETATYYSYQRTAALGVSTHLLMAQSHPIFARASRAQSFFRPVLSGSTFSGIALQNLRTTAVSVRLDLFSATNVLLASKTISLPANNRYTRDLAEIFPGVTPATGTILRVMAANPIQMLGLLGDDASGVVLPVEPAAAP